MINWDMVLNRLQYAAKIDGCEPPTEVPESLRQRLLRFDALRGSPAGPLLLSTCVAW